MGINLKRDKLSFTKRETHVINMILNGYSIDEISRSLLISKKRFSLLSVLFCIN
jgi:DNA-binding CsgD family transcriptional regulator